MRKLLCLIVLFMIPNLVVASGDELTNTLENENALNATVENTIKGDSGSVGIGYGPDNDINDCMAHWSALIVTFPKRNKFCERQAFVKWAETPEFHTPQSIKIMCSDPMGAEVFGDTQECILTFTPPDIPTTPPTPGPDEEETRPDEPGDISECEGCGPPEISIVTQQMAQHEEEYEGLEQRLARIERGNRIAAQKAQERREYAQMTIDKLGPIDESDR